MFSHIPLQYSLGIPALAVLLALAACDQDAPVTGSPASEREVLLSRAVLLSEDLQNEEWTTDERRQAIRALVADLESWNRRAAGAPIAFSVGAHAFADGEGPVPISASMIDPRPSPSPPAPCLLLGIPCDPVRYYGSWVCYNTGYYCDWFTGLPTCTYVCVEVGVA